MEGKGDDEGDDVEEKGTAYLAFAEIGRLVTEPPLYYS
jgi:hypothetical protein